MMETFVIFPEKLEKSVFGAERPGHKYTSRRKGPSGEWEYEYAEKKEPVASTEPQWRIHSIRDLRPIDWDTGKRLALTEGEGATCDRCGKEHAIVHTMEHKTTGEHKCVGSGCSSGMAGGTHNIDDVTRKQAEREAKDKVATQARAKIDQWTSEIVDSIRNTRLPEPSFWIEGQRFTQYHMKRDVEHKQAVWGFKDLGISHPMTKNQPDEQAVNSILSQWLQKEVEKRVAEKKIPKEWPFAKDLSVPKSTVESQVRKTLWEELHHDFEQQHGFHYRYVLPDEMKTYLKPYEPWEKELGPNTKVVTHEIEETTPQGTPSTTPHEHVGEKVQPKMEKLEDKVGASGDHRKQMDLFRSLSDNDFVLSGSDFDLCMSLADRYILAGEFDAALDLVKGATHKYLKRIPTGKVRPRWRYIYNITSQRHGAPVQVGEKVQVHHEGQAGHYEVEAVHPNDWVTVRHDETGQRLSLKQAHLHEMFSEDHQEAINAAHDRLKNAASAAKQFGTEEQQKKTQAGLREHEERFSIKTPERIATQKAQGLSVLTRTAPTVENHEAAALAHEYAAGFDTAHKALHQEAARLHREAAKLRGARQHTKVALTSPGVTFHTPGKTEAEKAGNPVLALPAKSHPPITDEKGKKLTKLQRKVAAGGEVKVANVGSRGEAQAKGAFFANKKRAYQLLVTDEHNANFHEADQAYWKFKYERGPKPPPFKGDLDAVNEALQLKAERRGFAVKDTRVSSLAEGWDRLIGSAKRWDSQRVIDAIETLRKVPGLENMQLPDEAQKVYDQMALEKEAGQRDFEQEGEAVDHEAQTEQSDSKLDDNLAQFSEADLSFDPDQLESEMGGDPEKEEFDTSFDFGFNVAPEHEDPKEAYKALGTKAKTFKAWFGDFEANPAEASKVVKKDGSPAEQHNMSPMPVYHGTAVGGFTHFDEKKVGRYNIFGGGFYFTEDKKIATEYTEKDAGEGKERSLMTGLTDSEGKEVTHLPTKWAQKLLDAIPGYGAKALEKGAWDPHGNSGPYLGAALKRALEPDGVNVTKFLQEFRNPSGPVIDAYGEVTTYGQSSAAESGLPGLVFPTGMKPVSPKPQVYECFLNVRKPVDMDAEISKEDFQDFSGYMNKLRGKFSEVNQYNPEERAHALNQTKWTPDERLAFDGSSFDTNKNFASMGDDKTWKHFSYEELLQAKQHVKNDTKADKSLLHPLFHVTDEKKLTWGDLHYFVTDAHNNSTEKGAFRHWAEQRGHDGITHTGGWNISGGAKPHKVWIAWKPHQIKATQNQGTFDPTTPDINKAMKYEPNIFVMFEECFQKSIGDEREGHKYIKREGGPGNYQYTYRPEGGPKPATVGPITPDDVEYHSEQLAKRPREELEAFDRRISNYVKKLGDSAPQGLNLWKRAVEGALAKVGKTEVAPVPKTEIPKFVATLPATPKVDVATPRVEPAKTKKSTPQMGFDFGAIAKEKPVKPVEVSKEKPVPAEKPVDAIKEKVKELAEGTERKIMPVGEHIWGSKKDLRSMHIESSKDLEKLTYSDAVKIVTKNHLIPAFDLMTLKGLGQSPGTAHMTLAMLASIVGKPGKNPEDQAKYVDEIHTVLGSLQNCKTVTDVLTLGEEMWQSYKNGTGLRDIPGVGVFTDRTEAWAMQKKLAKENPHKEIGVFHKGGHWSGEYLVQERVSKPYEALGNRFVNFLARNGKDAQAAYTEALTADNLWGSKDGGGRGFSNQPPVANGWDYLAQRGTAKATKAKALAEAKVKRGNIRGFSKAQLYAVGSGKAIRKGGVPLQPADERRTKATFNLKNLDYGTEKYMTQADREFHTSQIEGALHDLTDVLGIPKNLAGFSGRLGITAGGRGDKETPIAHYEPDKFVINLTKMEGGTALAHEWGHALDNFLANVHRPKGNPTMHLSDIPDASFYPEHIREAYLKVHKAMSLHPDPEKAKAAHEAHSKELYAKERELVTKYNGYVAKVKSIQGKYKPEIVPGAIKHVQENIERYKKELAAAEEKLKAKKSGRRSMKAMMEGVQTKAWLEQSIRKLAGLQDGSLVRKPEDDAAATEAAGNADGMRYQLNDARDAVNKHSEMDPTISDWKRGSTILGDYYSTPTEMFARAMECHVADELKKAGRQNTYLTSNVRTEHIFETDKMMPDGSHAQPYPHGEERKRILDAMGEFIRTIHSSGDLKKAFNRMFSQPLQRFVIHDPMT